MKYIQSFYQYPVTFSSIGKTVPSKDAEGDTRNIAAFEEAEIEKLEKSEPLYRALINEKKYRVLNKLPESYKPAATLVNEAREEAAKAKAELEQLKAQMETKESAAGDDTDLSKVDYKSLQAMAKEKGIENVNQKKADLIKAIKDAE